jgi:DNA polymerase-3 subunit gamma/tau
MTQVLYRKWRPQTFDQIVGQEHVTQTLRNALALGRIAHAYLFAGLRGTGKTTMARLVAKAVNCQAEDPADRPCNQCSVCLAVNEGRFLDLIEIDAASHTGVDDVRELRDKVGFRPNEGRYKVYIIDEVHRFSSQAFDALLKTIEEPPEHAIFILATTEIHKVPPTILSRCQRFDFRRIPVQQIIQRLQALADAEGIEAEPEAVALIARSATGSLRDAESLLDQLSAASVDGVTLAKVQATLGTIDAELVAGLVETLVDRDVARGLDLIDQALDHGADLRQFARQIVNYLRGMLLIKLKGADLLDTTEESRERMAAQAESIGTPALLEAIKRFNQTETELKGGWQPQLPLELALVEASLWHASDAAEPRAAAREPMENTPQPHNHDQIRESVSEYPQPESQATDREGQTTAMEQHNATATGVTLSVVQQHWRQVLENARTQDKSVQALLNSTYPGEAEDQVVTLHVAHEFAREKLSQRRAKRLVEDLISEVVGQHCQVEYKVVASQDDVLRGDPADIEPAQTNIKRHERRDEWADDPLAQAARQMGAEVRPMNEGSEK